MTVYSSLASFARAEIGGDPEDISDWQQVAEALYLRIIDLLPQPQQRLIRLNDEAADPLARLAELRAVIEAVPPHEEIGQREMQDYFDVHRILCRLDDEAAQLDLADALAFRYELRAAVAWAKYANLLTRLEPIE